MRLVAAILLGVTSSASGCYYELDPVDVPLDLGVPDLVGDLNSVETGDGPRCPGGGAPFHVGELTEPPIERWGAEPIEPLNVSPATTSVLLDPARVESGAGSLRLDTKNGQAGLFYPKTRDASFDLTPYLYVSFSVTADNTSPANDPGWQGAQPHLLLVTDSTNYLEFVPTDNRLPRAPGAFDRFTVPLAGGSGWERNRIGSPDLSRIRYLALLFDTWGAGFTVWVDDLRIGPGEFLDCGS